MAGLRGPCWRGSVKSGLIFPFPSSMGPAPASTVNQEMHSRKSDQMWKSGYVFLIVFIYLFIHFVHSASRQVVSTCAFKRRYPWFFLDTFWDMDHASITSKHQTLLQLCVLYFLRSSGEQAITSSPTSLTTSTRQSFRFLRGRRRKATRSEQNSKISLICMKHGRAPALTNPNPGHMWHLEPFSLCTLLWKETSLTEDTLLIIPHCRVPIGSETSNDATLLKAFVNKCEMQSLLPTFNSLHLTILQPISKYNGCSLSDPSPTLWEIWGWSKSAKGLLFFFLRELPHLPRNAPTLSSQQVAAHHLPSPLQEGSRTSHTKRPYMHIELSDLLRRPGQWCFKSSMTLGSLLSHSCNDRIGSEVCVGLKIDLLFWHELNSSVLYVSLQN